MASTTYLGFIIIIYLFCRIISLFPILHEMNVDLFFVEIIIISVSVVKHSPRMSEMVGMLSELKGGEVASTIFSWESGNYEQVFIF